MKSKIFAVLVLGLIVAAVPGLVLADNAGYSGDKPTGSAEISVPMSGPVGTGAIPQIKTDDSSSVPYSPNSTHYNPFYPELRPIDISH